MSDYDPTSIEGLPEGGIARLEQNKRGLFTSDLSVAEFLLVKEAGFDPLGLVVGSSIFHIGFQQSSWKISEEMTVLSEAMYAARELAMTRMEEEAEQLGAALVPGEQLLQRQLTGLDPARELLELLHRRFVAGGGLKWGVGHAMDGNQDGILGRPARFGPPG